MNEWMHSAIDEAAANYNKHIMKECKARKRRRLLLDFSSMKKNWKKNWEKCVFIYIGGRAKQSASSGGPIWNDWNGYVLLCWLSGERFLHLGPRGSSIIEKWKQNVIDKRKIIPKAVFPNNMLRKTGFLKGKNDCVGMHLQIMFVHLLLFFVGQWILPREKGADCCQKHWRFLLLCENVCTSHEVLWMRSV